MLDELYKAYQVDQAQWDAGFDITLKIMPGELPSTKKISKKMSDEEADKTREENDIVRIKRKELVEPIAQLIASFKTNWMSAPIRRAMNAALAHKQIPNCEIQYRASEKYWVMMPEKNEVQVYFAVDFTNSEEQKLARVMLLEW